MIDLADQGLSRCLMTDGYWEMWLTEGIEAVLRPGMKAIDIGANLGYFTLLMAERVGPIGNVHAFEPNPAMSVLLDRSSARNGMQPIIQVYTNPLWDEDDVPVLMRVPIGEPKNAHVTAGLDGEGLMLLTKRLDSYPELLDADVIKIDVEGAEEAIWRGMSGLFALNRPLTVFLEFTPARYADADAFLVAIEREGFAFREMSVSHGARSVTKAEILAGDPVDDRMLVLTR